MTQKKTANKTAQVKLDQQNSGNPTGASTRTEFERERDLTLIAEMYLQRIPQWKIAKKVGVSQAQISKDLKEIALTWRESALMDFNERKAKELAAIDNLERQAQQAYEYSCLPKKKHSRKTKAIEIESENAEGRKVATQTNAREVERNLTIEHQAPGNPAFLSTIQWCINRRIELLGLDAPRKTTLTDISGTKPYEQLSDEQLNAIARTALAKKPE